MPAIEESVHSMVDAVARDFRANHSGERYPYGITVSGGKKELGAPNKVASRPEIEPSTSPLSKRCQVDSVARSARELKVKGTDNKVVKAKFDVNEHLEVLCKQLVDQSICEAKMESHIDKDGKETITLIATEALQQRLPGT